MTRAQTGRNRKVPQRTKARGIEKKSAPAKVVNTAAKQSARKLDRVTRKFDAAVENLRGNLEVVSECLYELLAAEAGRECRRRFTRLAEAGTLHDLQILAAALESIPPEALPPSLVGVDRYAALAVSQLARVFDAQPTHQPGEEITVIEDQQAAFDWSADTLADRTFPLRVKILRSGWKCGSELLVKPKITRVTCEVKPTSAP